ncbi:hypothetical protein [Flavobacterium sp.]|jgi:hypothetical protein|uniref:hypothetical protein n=1 Tax=Flavobacterium sp. TaxID=239 RepID=UPI0037C12064
MAKQIGIIKLDGTIEGLNFYFLNGKPIARKSGGGFNGNAIKTKDSMVRVRENSREFGSSMVAVKAFKASIIPFLTQFKDGQLHQRLASLFSAIKRCDAVSERGKRHVGNGLATAAGVALLQNYVLTGGKNLAGVLAHSYRFDFATGLHLDEFDGKQIKFAKGSTHLKVVAGFLKIDFDSLTYQLVLSDVVYLDKASVGPITLRPLEPNVAAGKAIGLVFTQFVQETNGVFYPFKQVTDVVLEVVFVE